MSESKIRQVAIAIRRNKFERSGRLSVFDPSLITEDELGESRAAIEAMRTPTEEMIEAGRVTVGEFVDAKGTCLLNSELADVGYLAMIDAALSEKP